MGGSTQSPTYYNMADHTETVQFDFDPGRVSYESLVEAFFSFHDPTRGGLKRQYMSAIFVHDAEQERVAREVMSRAQQGLTGEIQTLILPAGPFNMAEDYHQKYALRGDRKLFAEYEAIYPDFWDVVDSPAASRVNAYLYGFGTPELLQDEIARLGLTEEGVARLKTASPAGSCLVD